MNWQTLNQFVMSADIIPFLFSLFLALLSPVFSKFVDEDLIRRHLPVGLKDSATDVTDFALDAVRKVGFISSIFIAAINSILVLARGSQWGIYPAVGLLALILLTFLVLPRTSAYDLHGTFLKVRKFRWLWIVTILVNIFLIFIAYDSFARRLQATPVQPPVSSASP